MKTARKELLKIVAVAAAGVIAGTGVTAATIGTAKKSDGAKNTATSVSSESDSKNEKAAKDETVYVLANADGSVKKVIVSDWIKNSLKDKTVKDKTELNDVKNVKGDESYVMDTDNMRVWNADGADIYYQGTISKELPVDLKVTYKLDGKTVSADEIAGKSGKVTIRFDYTNKQYSEVNIGGKTEKIYVPFAMLTGLMLDNDVFSNVSVTNGKIINDGDRTVVAGFALPGLQQNLNLSKDRFEIPDYIEITADAKKFALTTTLTLATNSLFNEFDTSKLNSADDLQAQLGELTSGMTKLIDGSSELYGGLTTLLSKSKELAAGVDKLAVGANDLSAGTAALSAGLNTLVSKNDDLTGGAKQVFDTLLATVSSQLAENGINVSLTIENYSEKLSDIKANPTGYLSDKTKSTVISAADTAVNAMLDGAFAKYNIPVPAERKELVYKTVKVMLYEQVIVEHKTTEQAKAYIVSVAKAHPEALAAKIAAVAGDPNGSQQKVDTLLLALGIQSGEFKTKLAAVDTAKASLDSYNTFYQGVLAYTAGVKDAADGGAKVNAGAKQLKDGTAELKSGVSQLVPGVEKLSDGSKQLADGIKELNDKGISKLTGLAGDDLRNLVDRVKATVDVSKNYKSFAGIADGADGSVKFIYKTDEVKTK